MGEEGEKSRSGCKAEVHAEGPIVHPNASEFSFFVHLKIVFSISET